MLCVICLKYRMNNTQDPSTSASAVSNQYDEAMEVEEEREASCCAAAEGAGEGREVVVDLPPCMAAAASDAREGEGSSREWVHRVQVHRLGSYGVLEPILRVCDISGQSTPEANMCGTKGTDCVGTYTLPKLICPRGVTVTGVVVGCSRSW